MLTPVRDGELPDQPRSHLDGGGVFGPSRASEDRGITISTTVGFRSGSRTRDNCVVIPTRLLTQQYSFAAWVTIVAETICLTM
jgi:hypothetical protein